MRRMPGRGSPITCAGFTPPTLSPACKRFQSAMGTPNASALSG